MEEEITKKGEGEGEEEEGREGKKKRGKVPRVPHHPGVGTPHHPGVGTPHHPGVGFQAAKRPRARNAGKAPRSRIDRRRQGQNQARGSPHNISYVCRGRKE